MDIYRKQGQLLDPKQSISSSDLRSSEIVSSTIQQGHQEQGLQTQWWLREFGWRGPPPGEQECWQAPLVKEQLPHPKIVAPQDLWRKEDEVRKSAK